MPEPPKVGDDIDTRGFSSFTDSLSIAKDFAGTISSAIGGIPCIFEVDNVKQGVSVKAWSEYPEENEYILSGFIHVIALMSMDNTPIARFEDQNQVWVPIAEDGHSLPRLIKVKCEHSVLVNTKSTLDNA